MALFKEDKKKKMEKARKKAEEAKRKQLEKIVKLTEVKLPKKKRFAPLPREYTELLKEMERKPETKYEKSCAFAEKILRVKPSPKLREKLEEDLKTAFINATPEGVLSFTIITTLLILMVFIIGLFLGIGLTFAMFGLIFVGGVAWYFYNYPSMRARSVGLQMSGDTVLAILYMIIYMRTSPNLEGALKFAAENLRGPLSWDLKKLVWDMEVGTYPSADVAILNYIERWKNKNKEFSEALHLLRGSALEAERREILFNQTIDVILSGTRERTRHYAAGLRMPMMLVHAMGVLLPVMGLVLFPVVLIFMSDVVKPSFIMFGYNIILPAAIYFFMDYILQSKPPTFSQPEVSKSKGIPPLGKMYLGRKLVSIWPFALILSLPLVLIGLFGLASPNVYISVNFSILVIFGIAIGIAIYCLLDSWQKLRVRKDIERIEDEFSVALFQLGNQISGGLPIELAIDKAVTNLKNLKISELFKITSMNMKKFGYTFEQALFDKEVGAIWYYPSNLIQSIMRTLMESSKKSISAASTSMITISRYLKDVHNVKEEIKEILGETISSMKFLAMFLAPLIAGVTVTMAVIILQILTSLGAALGSLITEGATNAAQGMFLTPWALAGEVPIAPAGFQMIVGIYMIEIAILLSMFLNKIEYGEDVIGERSIMGQIILIAVFVYFFSWLAVYSMFGGPIESLLTVGIT